MTWQDIAIFGASMVLNAAVVPTLLDDGAKVPRWQSVPTAICLAVMAFAYLTIGLWFATASTLFGAVLWVHVAVYRTT